MLGIESPSLAHAIDLAARHGFPGVDANPGYLANLSDDDIARLKEKFAATGTRPGYTSLPPGRIPEAGIDWEGLLAALPAMVRTAAALGYTRSAYVLLPFHETLGREAAMDEHVDLLHRVTGILADYGMSLGLEYVAAPTRRAPYAVHTVYDLAGTLELIERVGAPNLGLMLDTFHWHGAGESVDDLLKLRPEQVVVVHANDAPDLPLEEHTVVNRALPGETGVIDSAGFFGALRAIGYEGPVTCEPMMPAVEKLGLAGPDEVLERVKGALRDVMSRL